MGKDNAEGNKHVTGKKMLVSPAGECLRHFQFNDYVLFPIIISFRITMKNVGNN